MWWWCCGVFVVVRWCGGVFVVVWWCGGAVVFLWWCGGVFVVVVFFVVVWCFCGGGGVFVVVFVWWCFCGGVVCGDFVVVWWCFCGGLFVVVFLWWCSCGDVFVVVLRWWRWFLWWCGGVFVVVWCFCGGGVKDCHRISPKVLLKWWLSAKIVLKHRPKFYWSHGCLYRLSSNIAQSSTEVMAVFKDCHQTSPKVLLKWWLSLQIVIQDCPKFCWSDGCI